ncbi:MAG: NUDIX hydrolase [Lachnospiraceae bacterium]|nr:NUDIX hydrolase [Lachnospiraceae bacterium]
MERFRKVKKLTDNPFLNMYDMDAVKLNGETFKYYFATRRGDDLIRIRSHSTDPDGISLFAVYGEKRDRVVLIREFRYPINDFIYDVPAGLIEPGEDAKKAAIREFKEETGMIFEPVERGNKAARKSAFPTVGLTDEMISTEYGYASGTPDKSFMESSEDITTVIADRKELRRIIKEERIAMRALFLIMLFLNAPEDDPFAFLEC